MSDARFSGSSLFTLQFHYTNTSDFHLTFSYNFYLEKQCTSNEKCYYKYFLIIFPCPAPIIAVYDYYYVLLIPRSPFYVYWKLSIEKILAQDIWRVESAWVVFLKLNKKSFNNSYMCWLWTLKRIILLCNKTIIIHLNNAFMTNTECNRSESII